MARHIGIVACSAEGAALCYRTICAEAAEKMGPHAHPEIALHSNSLADYVAALERNDLDAVANIMLDSASKLQRTGAEFVICPDNTIHQAIDRVTSKSPLPWLNIACVVADEASRKGFRRLALLGTKWLCESGVYPVELTKRGIEYERPEPKERSEIHRIIMEELGYGVFKPESVASLERVIARMRDEDGCDAVVLGCTELPLVLGEENSPLPPLDSTRLLARAALRKALS